MATSATLNALVLAKTVASKNKYTNILASNNGSSVHMIPSYSSHPLVQVNVIACTKLQSASKTLLDGP